MKYLLFPLLIISLFCRAKDLPDFKASDQPAAPDYANEKNWSALPFRKDKADFTRKHEKWVDDSVKQVDVFYIYPTLYMKGNTWCADLNDEKLNKKEDALPVKYHTSIFNRVARVYAPRYRQAIIQSFFDSTGNGKKALDFAYEDVKAAFEYYMKHYNHGRSIILVSHSQGTAHARRLLKDYFDTPEMREKLVCAYVVGFGIYPEKYELLKPCDQPEETNCYVTWSSFHEGYIPDKDFMLYGKTCINPISWKTDSLPATERCGLFINLNKRKPFKTSASVHKEKYLWVKSKMLLTRVAKIYHPYDFNLFWLSIRRNAELRTAAYLKQHP